MVPLFTSIPPHFSRKNKDGQDVGSEYARMCIRSWRSAGFDPVTVNSKNESLARIISEENIKRIAVDRDAQAQFGRPLVFLGDFIDSICNYEVNGPVVITNADIVIDISSAAYQKLAGLQPGQCFVSKRCDVEEMNSRSGSEYAQGYDFFAFHSSDLKNFKSNDYVMGLPWWDHYLPIWMYLMGLEQLSIKEKFVFHLFHAERWDFEKWVVLVDNFLHFIKALKISDKNFSGPVNDYVFRAYPEINKRDPGLRGVVKYFYKKLTISGRLEEKIKSLHGVADVNVRWLDKFII